MQRVWSGLGWAGREDILISCEAELVTSSDTTETSLEKNTDILEKTLHIYDLNNNDEF